MILFSGRTLYQRATAFIVVLLFATLPQITLAKNQISNSLQIEKSVDAYGDLEGHGSGESRGREFNILKPSAFAHNCQSSSLDEALYQWVCQIAVVAPKVQNLTISLKTSPNGMAQIQNDPPAGKLEKHEVFFVSGLASFSSTEMVRVIHVEIYGYIEGKNGMVPVNHLYSLNMVPGADAWRVPTVYEDSEEEEDYILLPTKPFDGLIVGKKP